MVDYGGKMPELQEHLCELLKRCQKESPSFEHLRVMVIEDMIYLIHVKGLAEYVSSSLSSEAELHFVDLEQDPPKMITLKEKSSVGMQLISVQKLFSLVFPPNGMTDEIRLPNRTDHTIEATSSNITISPQSTEVVDLSSCICDSQSCLSCDKFLRSEHGLSKRWLLGYPVVYLFDKEHIADAIYNLSTQSLRIFKILVTRNGPFSKGSMPEELMSFSVPYELSMEGSNEPWAEMFLAKMQSKWAKCDPTWRTLQMEMLLDLKQSNQGR
ncbi:hypothetical protein KPL71_009355 [Citrus sinensis]|uniref:Uncharacterized protein n=1 Tax=Citrus sinensis TaxID=2711 RepID=A0ACB8MCC7_CITSI|nr:hypothetical protein KPL71_009355 [Citrus sinensis]